MQLLRILFVAGALVALLAGCGTATGSLPAPTTPAATAAPAADATVSPATAVPEPTGSTQEDALLVSLKRSGGIAGISETISVYSSGRVEVSNRGGQVRTTEANPADLDTLRGLLASPELAQANSDYKANGADLFTYELTLPTDGKPRTITTMDGAGHPEIISKLIAEIGRLRPAK